MSIIDSLFISLFGLTIVFVVLISISAIVVVQSKLVAAFHKKSASNTGAEDNSANEPVPVESAPAAEVPQIIGTAGSLKLIDVDEKTAAAIMAIVSHESQIPLNELQFKAIKALH